MRSLNRKFLLSILALAICIAGCNPKEGSPTPAASAPLSSDKPASRPRSETELRRQIEAIRMDKDRFLRQAPNSPLPEEERADFKGLKYFPVDPGYHFECALKRYDGNERVKMLETDGEQREYIRYGYLEFQVGSTPCRLDAFKATFLDDSQRLFIPFRDSTSGKETYGAGRYIDLEETADEHYLLDFNLAFNPYCAYNPNQSCPIPPPQNTLKVAIRAGEKSYHD